MADVQTAAKTALTYLTNDSNGNIHLTDNAPDWLHTLTRVAHDGMLPDNHRYSYIADALERLADTANIDEIKLEPDIYHNELLDWLHTNQTRIDYCDQAMAEFATETLMGTLAVGQLLEREDVLHLVYDYLADMPDSALAA